MVSEEEIDAIKYVWSNPHKMERVRISPLGEGKDLRSQKDIKNLENKKKRGIVRYNVYKFEYKNKTYHLKLEEHRAGFEQMYPLTKER